MTSRTLPGLGLTGGRSAGESGWASEMNLNLLTLSVLGQGTVKSRVTGLPGSPTNGDIYIVPHSGTTGVWVGKEDQIAVRDNGVWVYLVPTEGWRIYVKDEDVQVVHDGTIWGSLSTTVYLGAFSEAAPLTSQILMDWQFADAALLPDNFAGSVASVGTNPAGSFTIDVKKNGSNVGTIVISTGGAATFNTTGTTVAFASGDLLTLVAPASADASIARLRVTLKGTR